MPTAVIMPKFEMTQETGKVAKWLKAEGDAVQKGEAILEVETDKVNLEVEASTDGILMGITAHPGDTVPIGQTIAYLVKPGESFSGAGPAPAGQVAVDTAQPAPSRSSRADAANTVSASPLAIRMADSLGVDVAFVKGTGPRGQVTREDVEDYVSAQHTPSAPADGTTRGGVRAVPAARRVARELGVDLHTVIGTGPEGRIQPDDVRAYLEPATAKVPAAAGVGEPAVVQPSRLRHPCCSPAVRPSGAWCR